MTLGDLYPHLKKLPGYEEIAARPVEYSSPPPPPSEPPGLLEMAGGVLKAGAKLLADGGRLSTEEFRESRLAICATCPKYEASNSTCKICGCYLKVKVTLPREACPDNPPRWGPA